MISKKEYTENREEKLLLILIDYIIISHLDAKLERGFINGVPKKPKRLSGFVS